MKLVRRLISAATVLVCAMALGGCVIRPLNWGDHDHYEHHDRVLLHAADYRP